MPDRALLKQEAKGILRGARVSPYLFTLVVLVISFVIGRVSDYVQWDTATRAAYEARLGIDLSFLPFCHAPFPGAVTLFVAILCSLLSVILSAGVILYHLGIRRGEARPIETLFDGFFFAGKIILLYIVMAIFITLWSMLLFFPGIIAAYRYRFAMYNLCENPEMGVMEALNMSKVQTRGHKWELFVLDLSFIGWNLLCGLTLGILSIWIMPYIQQTDIGYFQAIKQMSGVGVQPPRNDGGFYPDDRFDGGPFDGTPQQ